MKNRPKMPPKFTQKPQKQAPKKPEQPKATYIYRKDAFNKVKIT